VADEPRKSKFLVMDRPGATLFLACCGPAAISVAVAYLDETFFGLQKLVLVPTLLANLLIAATGGAAVGWITQTKPADKPGIAVAVGILAVAGYVVFTAALFCVLPIGIRH